MTTVLVLNPVSACCGSYATTTAFSVTNPQMQYDITVGTPISLATVPLYPALPASSFEKNGNGPIYVWNATTATWHPN